ncbi:MAG: hypothetical protein ACRD5E_05365 [Nitrososphaeraceae archaeon]
MTVATPEIKNQTSLCAKFEGKLQSAVEGLNPYFHKILLELSKQNSTYIIDYVINDLKRENNASINYIRMNIYAIVDLAKYCKKEDIRKLQERMCYLI